MRHTTLVTSVALVAAAALSGCLGQDQAAQNGASNTSSNQVAELTLPSGSSINVTLTTPLTSETANTGSAWTGSVTNAYVLAGKNIIPAGSLVAGTVTSVKPAVKGDRAMLDLGLTSFTVDGHRYPVRASTEAITAGSTRARNLGAIAGGAAAGALVGKAVSGSNKGTIIGGIVGGGAATGVVAASDGYQVVLKEGTLLTFTTNEAVAVRH